MPASNTDLDTANTTRLAAIQTIKDDTDTDFVGV